MKNLDFWFWAAKCFLFAPISVLYGVATHEADCCKSEVIILIRLVLLLLWTLVALILSIAFHVLIYFCYFFVSFLGILFIYANIQRMIVNRNFKEVQ